MNVKGVFLHVMADALGSVVVLISAAVIWLTDWEYKVDIDSVDSVDCVDISRYLRAGLPGPGALPGDRGDHLLVRLAAAAGLHPRAAQHHPATHRPRPPPGQLGRFHNHGEGLNSG